MLFHFCKTHGAGNDFIIADNRQQEWPYSSSRFIKNICDRKRGIGADGLILLQNPQNLETADFQMLFFNCDGSRAEMCGNGLRCAIRFAYEKMAGGARMTILTDVGILSGEVLKRDKIQIEVPIVKEFTSIEIDGRIVYFGNSGVPHMVVPLEEHESIENFPLLEKGAKWRWHSYFGNEGTNVDICKKQIDGCFQIRTYERGVEGETMACGTGIVAVATCMAAFFHEEYPIRVVTQTQDLLTVSFPYEINKIGNVYLDGPAMMIMSGTFDSELFM